ncbi:MAG: hypothetical protein RR398_07310, partial [Clostridia bacterium]
PSATVVPVLSPTLKPTNAVTVKPSVNPTTTPVTEIPFCIYTITSVDKKANTVTAAEHQVLFHLAGDINPVTKKEYGNDFTEICDPKGKDLVFSVNDQTEIFFGDIFNSTNGDVKNNVKTTLAFFMDNATKKFNGTPLYFFFETSENTLTNITLWWMYYFAG